MRRLLVIAIITGIGYGVWSYFVRDGCGSRGALACGDAAIDEGLGKVLPAAEVCRDSGYLCQSVAQVGSQVRRYPFSQGKLRVRVAMPHFDVEEDLKRDLRAAVIEGILSWHREPFPIYVDTGNLSLSPSNFSVVWVQGQGGGHARVWFDERGDGKRPTYRIDAIQVVIPATRFDPGSFNPAGMSLERLKSQMGHLSREEMLSHVRATAAHEMGHVLGLMHSDRQSDVMFPEWKPGISPEGPSQRDLATLRALYSLPNGARIQ